MRPRSRFLSYIAAAIIPGMTGPQRRTKIVATWGPALASEERLRAAIDAGVDVFRLNFSHATHEEIDQIIPRIRSASAAAGRPVALLQDIQGPRLRTGEVEAEEGVVLQNGASLHVTSERVPVTAETVSVPYGRLANDVNEGDRILIADGRIVLRVTAKDGDRLAAEVVTGGALTSHKGVNLPDSHVTADPLTLKDKEDLAYGASVGVDYVALSFVRTGSDVEACRAILRELGAAPPIISKIEHPLAIGNLREILDASDGVMVARGDLGVEVSPERVPLLQKRIIAEANEAGLPVITATQMLESMIDRPMPTRAEASDIANAILDRTDAVMLSAETAVGQYPVEAVATMARIALEAEAAEIPHHPRGSNEQPYAIAEAARALTENLKARAMLVFSSTGRTAKTLSHQRPTVPVYAFTADQAVCRSLMLWYGVWPIQFDMTDRMQTTVEGALKELEDRGAVAAGDRVVVVGATPVKTGSLPNLINVRTVGRP